MPDEKPRPPWEHFKNELPPWEHFKDASLDTDVIEVPEEVRKSGITVLPGLEAQVERPEVIVDETNIPRELSRRGMSTTGTMTGERIIRARPVAGPLAPPQAPSEEKKLPATFAQKQAPSTGAYMGALAPEKIPFSTDLTASQVGQSLSYAGKKIVEAEVEPAKKLGTALGVLTKPIIDNLNPQRFAGGKTPSINPFMTPEGRKAMTDVISSGIDAGLTVLAPWQMIALRAVSPPAHEILQNSGEDIGRSIGGEKGAKYGKEVADVIARYGTAALFGKPVVVGQAASDISGESAEVIARAAGVSDMDAEALKEIAGQVGFFAGLSVSDVVLHPEKYKSDIVDVAKKALSKQIQNEYDTKGLIELGTKVQRGEATPQEQDMYKIITATFKSPKAAAKEGIEVTGREYRKLVPEKVKESLGEFPKPEARVITDKDVVERVAQTAPVSAQIIPLKLARKEKLTTGEQALMDKAKRDLTAEEEQKVAQSVEKRFKKSKQVAYDAGLKFGDTNEAKEQGEKATPEEVKAMWDEYDANRNKGQAAVNGLRKEFVEAYVHKVQGTPYKSLSDEHIDKFLTEKIPTAEGNAPSENQREALNLIEKYDDGEIDTIGDLVDEIRDLDDPRFQDAIDTWDQEVADDRKLGGRGDLDAAEEAFLKAIKEPQKETPAEGNTAAIKRLSEAGRTRDEIKTALNVTDEEIEKVVPKQTAKVFDIKLGADIKTLSESDITAEIERLQKEVGNARRKWIGEESLKKVPDFFPDIGRKAINRIGELEKELDGRNEQTPQSLTTEKITEAGQSTPKEKLAQRITEASRRPDLPVIETRELKGSNGKWYRAGGFPLGVESTGEVRVRGYVLQNPDGTTSGSIYPTREAAIADQKARHDKQVKDFYNELIKMSDTELEKQQMYWLKDEVLPPQTSTNNQRLFDEGVRKAEEKDKRQKEQTRDVDRIYYGIGNILKEKGFEPPDKTHGWWHVLHSEIGMYVSDFKSFDLAKTSKLIDATLELRLDNAVKDESTGALQDVKSSRYPIRYDRDYSSEDMVGLVKEVKKKADITRDRAQRLSQLADISEGLNGQTPTVELAREHITILNDRADEYESTFKSQIQERKKEEVEQAKQKQIEIENHRSILEQPLAKAPIKAEKWELTVPGVVNVQPIRQKVQVLPKTREGALKILEDVVSDDQLRIAMTGVYFDSKNGVAVATDGHALSAIPMPDIATSEIISPSDPGVKIDEKFPDWKSVVPPESTPKYKGVDLIDLVADIRGLAKSERWFEKEYQAPSARIENGEKPIYLRGSIALRALEPLQKAGTKSVSVEFDAKSQTRPIVFRDEANPEQFALVMPQKESEVPSYKSVIGNTGEEQKTEPVTLSQSIRDQFKEKFKLTDKEADAQQAILDARAQAWSKQTGKPAEDWYKEHIADIQAGGTVGEEALAQEGTEFFDHVGDVVSESIERPISSEKVRELFKSKGITDEELRFTGIDKFLDTRKAQKLEITRADMMNFVTQKQSLHQGKKGAIEFLKDGRAIIHAFEGADISTVVHEIGHIFRRDLLPDDLKIAEDWAGVKNGDWTREAEEKFARGFERYLRDGDAPTENLRSVFEQFKEWLSRIYQKIKGSAIDIKISKAMRGVFDRLFTGEIEENPVEENIPDVKEPTKITEHELPTELKNAKPRYNYGSKPFVVKFMSDTDMALYITQQSKKSLRDADYRAFLKSLGFSDVDIESYGKKIRSIIKMNAAVEPGGTQKQPQELVIANQGYQPSHESSGTLSATIVPGLSPQAIGKAFTKVSDATSNFVKSSKRQLGKSPPEIEEAKQAMLEHHRQLRDASFLKWELKHAGERLYKEYNIKPDRQLVIMNTLQDEAKWLPTLSTEEKEVYKLAKKERDKLQQMALDADFIEDDLIKKNPQYLYQWWLDKNTGKPYSPFYGRLAKSAPQEHKKFYSSYEEGIKAGKTPASTNAFELIGLGYEGIARANSTRSMVSALAGVEIPSAGNLKRSRFGNPKPLRVIERWSTLKQQGKTDGYTRYDHPSLDKRLLIKLKNDVLMSFEGAIGVKDELIPFLRAYVESPKYGKLSRLAFAAKTLKLMSGFHVFSLQFQALAGSPTPGKIPIYNIVRGLHQIKEGGENLRLLYRNGLDVKGYADTGNYDSYLQGPGLIKSTLRATSDFTFNVVHPGIKVYTSMLTFEDMLSRAEESKGSALTEAEKNEIAQKAVKFSNALYSGEDYRTAMLMSNEWMARNWYSPEARKRWQNTLLSPTWQKEHLQMAKDAFKAFTNERGELDAHLYRRYIYGALSIYAMANLLNWVMTKKMDGEGQFMVQNPNAFTIRMPWNSKDDHRIFAHPLKSIFEIPEFLSDPIGKSIGKLAPFYQALGDLYKDIKDKRPPKVILGKAVTDVAAPIFVNQLFDSEVPLQSQALNVIGIPSRQYLHPYEEIMRDKLNERGRYIPPDEPNEKSEVRKALVEKRRSGLSIDKDDLAKLVKSGLIDSGGDIDRSVIDALRYSPNQLKFRRLELKDAVEVWKAMTPAQQRQYLEIYAKKIENGLSKQ